MPVRVKVSSKIYLALRPPVDEQRRYLPHAPRQGYGTKHDTKTDERPNCVMGTKLGTFGSEQATEGSTTFCADSYLLRFVHDNFQHVSISEALQVKHIRLS